MNQSRNFNIKLKNDQVIELKFTSIAATNDQLWQMFATTEALDMVQRLCELAEQPETKSARKTLPKPVASKKVSSAKKKNK
jgi:hypothetical protein